MLKLSLKLVALLSVVAGLQIWLTHRQGTHIAAYFDKVVNERPDVIYFGDSTIGSCDPLDRDRRATTAMLASELREHSVGGFARPAYHAEIYELFFNRMLRSDHLPETVVIPINLRSMSPIWDFDPSAQVEVVRHALELENNLVRRAIEPLARTLGIGPANSITRQEYMSRPVYRGTEMVGRVADFRNGSVDEQLILNYMYSLDKSHRKVAALQRMAKVARSHELRILYYVTPVDYQAATPELADALAERVRENVSTLRPLLEETGAELLDLSLALDSDGFTYERRVNEHLKSRGRVFVSQRIAATIR